MAIMQAAVRRFLFALSILALVVEFGVVGGSATTTAPNLHVFSCQVVAGDELPKRYDIGLAVRFENDSPVPYSSIVWRAQYRDMPVDFIDDGTFSPSTQIDNYLLFEAGSTKVLWFNVLAGAFLAANGQSGPTQMSKPDLTLAPYAGTEYPENCTIVRAIDADGRLWLNPAVPQDPSHVLPSPTPFTPIMHKPVALKPPLEIKHASGPIEIDHCTLSFDVKQRVDIGFRSVADRPADRITFRAHFASTGLDFADVGTFSPGVEIRHRLSGELPQELQHMMYLGYDDPNRCDVVAVHYADGTSWMNDAIPASAPPLPTPPPNAIDLTKARPKWTQRHAYPTPVPSP